MKLSTVLGSVNNNPNYYSFIPKQISFWGNFNIRFIAIFIGEKLPEELIPYLDHIIIWNRNLDLHDAYVAQNIRIFFPALLDLPVNEMVMITDMDMLPTNKYYYTTGLEDFTTCDFIYYRHIDGNQIYMCYNAAHPSTWSTLFKIKTEQDIEQRLREEYQNDYNGIPGSNGWFIDQEILYNVLHDYPHLQVLNRPIKRLEVDMYHRHLECGDIHFISQYDDVHFHRSYFNNETIILNAEKQLIRKKKVLSFCLYGDNPMYNIGAIQNAKDAIEVYPDFECWFYIHQETVPIKTVEALEKKRNVRIIFKTGNLAIVKPRMWRFEPIDDPMVELLMSRDTDTRIWPREKAAVNEWLNSGCIFHIMRDHPYHFFTILAGMFGTKKIPEIPSWIDIIDTFVQDGDFYDQAFLEKYIYPIVKENAMIHATFHRKESNCRYFPVEYDNEYHFVGEYVYADDSRNKEHIQYLKTEYQMILDKPQL